MSGLIQFKISILQFDKDKRIPTTAHNLKTLYDIDTK